LFTELRVRRLKWLQAVAADVHGNVQLLASVFGEIDGEAVLDAEGRIDRGVASPWALQMEEDVMGLSNFDDGDSFLELVCVDGRPSFRKLFGEFSEDLKQLDMGTLRAVALRQAIPPPGQPPDESGHERDSGVADGGLVCE